MNTEILIKSINNLEVNAKPEWGEMSASQMLKHCNKHTKLYCNESKRGFVSFFRTLILGKIHLFYVKYYVRYDIHKYKKNSYSPSILRTLNTKDINFNEEKNRLISQIVDASKFNKRYRYTPLHGWVKNKTFKKNIEAHIKYHLYQFDALIPEK